MFSFWQKGKASGNGDGKWKWKARETDESETQRIQRVPGKIFSAAEEEKKAEEPGRVTVAVHGV